MDPFDPFASDQEDEEEEEDLFASVNHGNHNNRYVEELYNEVATRHMPPLGLGPDDDDYAEDEDESVSQHEDVFGMSLADVDLWDDDDDVDPFAPTTIPSPQGIDFPGFPSIEGSTEKKERDSSRKSSSKTQNSSSRSSDAKRRSSKSSSRDTPHRSKSCDDVELLVPELSSTLTMKKTPFSPEKDRSERRSSGKSQSRSRQAPPRSRSSNFAKEDFGDGDRIGELLNLIKKENAHDDNSRRERSVRVGSERGDRKLHPPGEGVSLRQKLMTEMPSSSDKRRTSSSASACSSGKKVSSTKKEDIRHSHDESFRSWNDTSEENGMRSPRHQNRTSRRSSSKTNNADGQVGLDSFMKSTRTSSSRRGDAEHRSVASAPATTSAEALSKRCQKMKLTF